MKVLANVAISLDGKLNTRENQRLRFGTEADLQRMQEIRAKADAVLVGGQTFRHWPLEPKAGQAQQTLLHAIVSHSLDLHFSDGYLQNPQLKTVVYTDNETASTKWPEKIETVFLKKQNKLVEDILADLQQRGVQTLLLEAGGGLLWHFFQARVVDEIFVTVCPKIFGGATSPSLVDGVGFLQSEIQNLKLLESQVQNDEIFLHYKVKK